MQTVIVFLQHLLVGLVNKIRIGEEATLGVFVRVTQCGHEQNAVGYTLRTE